LLEKKEARNREIDKMSKFNCICVDGQGQKTQIHHEANSVPEVSSFLRERGLTPISVEEIKSKGLAGQLIREFHFFFSVRRVKAAEITIFFRQLATMLAAGISLSECLENLSSQTDNKNFAGLIKELRKYVVYGNSFSQALSEYPHLFPPLVTEMVTIGEETGSLDKIIFNLVSYLEAQIALKKKVISVSRYPLFVFCFFMVVVGVMVFFLIPTFKVIFSSYGAQVPILTQFIIDISNFLVRGLPYEVILFLGMSLLGYGYLHTAKGRALLDTLKLKIPIMAKITHSIVLARICRSMGTLLESGVSLTTALEHTAIANNIIAEKALRQIRKKIIQGSILSQELRNQSFFPSLIAGMVQTGEESGKLGDILLQIASFYESEADYRIKAVISILEPVLIIGVGIMIGLFIISMYLPIFNLGNIIR